MKQETGITTTKLWQSEVKKWRNVAECLLKYKLL